MGIRLIVSVRRFEVAWLLVGLASFVTLMGCGGSDDDKRGAIAFTVSRSGFGEVWVMDSDGSNRIQLTESSGPEVDASGATSPAWSPDGTLIAFASSGEATEEDQRDDEIYVMRSDGSERRRLTKDDVHDGAPAWSPDGQRIAFGHTPGLGTDDADGVIAVMNADGSARAEITRHPETPQPIFDSTPAWSPDGRLIAFTRATFTPEGAPHAAIYTIDPAGDGERLLIDDGGDPAWSPDGSMIAFTSVRNRNGETCFHDCSRAVRSTSHARTEPTCGG